MPSTSPVILILGAGPNIGKALARIFAAGGYKCFCRCAAAILGFDQLPSSAARTFIYTGNVTNVAILPKMLSSGVGKSGAAHMIWAASVGYKDRGYKFYYADERKEDGSPKYRIDGDAHAKLYWELAHAKTQGPWMQTFVAGVGYKKFDTIYTPLA
ncbi:hypothetical protein NXS19_000056 [Fusarium pseudograminearum]|nr:hypothetical protein NXS19_000056 [Fusarium pseudograminearum]